jgi:glutamine cyclotransferase
LPIDIESGSVRISKTIEDFLLRFSFAYRFRFAAFVGLLLAAVTTLSCRKQSATSADGIPVLGYRILRQVPHDPSFWTQGLVFDAGFLYEGTGGYGDSGIFKIAPSSGQILQSRTLESDHFGEGITIFENRLIQLTWKSRVGFVYDKTSFSLLKSFSYPMEGWGLTHNGRELILSDGTDTLHFLDSQSFAELRQVKVAAAGRPVTQLNELEFVNGRILANIWQSDRVAQIDPDTGAVTAWIDLSGLFNAMVTDAPVDVLNGIAFNPNTGRLWVTGKLWPTLFEIELVTNPTLKRP